MRRAYDKRNSIGSFMVQMKMWGKLRDEIIELSKKNVSPYAQFLLVQNLIEFRIGFEIAMINSYLFTVIKLWYQDQGITETTEWPYAKFRNPEEIAGKNGSGVLINLLENLVPAKI